MWLTAASAMHYGAYVHGTFLQRLKSHRHATGTSTSLNCCIVNRNTDMVRKAGSRDRICYCSLLWPVTSLRRCTMSLFIV